MSCDSTNCALGKVCAVSEGKTGLCGGVLTFDKNMAGQAIGPDVNVQDEYLSAGVKLRSDSTQAVVRTNAYALKSQSGKNSCATKVGQNEYWTHPIAVSFVLPGGTGSVQGAVYDVSLYIGQTWPGGIVVRAYAPNYTPFSQGQPMVTKYTEQNGTAFVEISSVLPMGHLVIEMGDDGDFTIDDLTFGAIHPVD